MGLYYVSMFSLPESHTHKSVCFSAVNQAAATSEGEKTTRDEPADDQRKSVGFSDSCSLFAICHPLVPSYLPMRVIEKVTYIA